MDINDDIFKIIRFTGTEQQYYGASIDMPAILLESGNYIKHTEIELPIGISRYGGPIMDLPEGMTPPENLSFVGQLDLSAFSTYDPFGILPQKGHLIFFADIYEEVCQVSYTDCPNQKLIRTIKEHDNDFFAGTIINNIYTDTETWKERFRKPYEEELTDELLWDYFAGAEKSKIFGIYTHCQLEQEQIEEITHSDKLLLLQIGENGFNDEGVLSFLIPREDLLQKRFDRCEVSWSQS